MFWYADGEHGNFSGSLMEACYAITGWTSMIPIGASGTPAQFASLTNGQTVYFEPTTSCTTFPDGYYIVMNGSTPNVLHMSGGVIAQYPENCPNITPTPTPTVTPTVTPSITVSPSVTPSITISPTPSMALRVAFNVDPSVPYGSTGAACAGSPTWYNVAYLESGYAVPTVGAYFYTTQISGGSTTYSPGACGGPSYYLFSDGVDIWALQVGNNTPVGGCDNDGEILNVTYCGPVPSPTPTPTITPSITVSPSVTPSITVSPTITPTPTVTPSSTPPLRLEFDIDPSVGYGSSSAACAGSPTWLDEVYLEGGYSVPTVGAYFYTTQISGGTTGYATGCPNYYLVSNGSTIWACQIAHGGGGLPCGNPAGYIVTVVECVPPSPTPTPTVTPSITITPTVTPSITISPSPSPAPRLAFDVDPSQPYGAPATACAGSPTWLAVAYLEAGYSVPTVGAYFYTTSGGSTEYAPGGCVGPTYYLFRNGTDIWALQVGNNTPVSGCDNTGEILSATLCVAPTPTPTPTVTPTVTPTITPTISPVVVSPTPTPTLTPTPTVTPDCYGDENPYTGGTEACWSFEEASGTFYDSTVNNEDLTTVVGVTYQQPPKIGTYSALFGTTTSYAESGSSFTMTDFSVSAWIKLVGTTTDDRVIYSQYNTGAAGAGYKWLVTSSRQLKFILQKPFSSGSATTTGTIALNTWTHVTVTYDYSTGTFHQYINGYDSGGPWAGGTNNASTSNYRIGNDNVSHLWGYSLRGYIDNLVVFSKVLKRCEVRYLWNYGTGHGCP